MLIILSCKLSKQEFIHSSSPTSLAPRESLVYNVSAQLLSLCLTLCGPLDCNLPVSSVHGIFQARILEWVAIFSSRENLPDPGIEPVSPASLASQVDSLPTEPLGKPLLHNSFSVNIGSVWWQNNKKCPSPNPEKCDYVLWHGQEDLQFQRVISFVKQLTSNQRDYPGLSEWALCDHKCLPMWKTDMEEKVLSSDAVWRGLNPLSLALETEEESRNVGTPRNQERQGNALSPKTSRRSRALPAPWF